MSIERPSVYSALVDLNCTPKKDRLRIAQERREEKERIQAAREQALLAKEQRAQKQLERSAEERGRRLEQQRQREVLRRAAVDEKRRQQEELEKERLEALLRRSMERGPPMDQRPKRWTWGGQPGDCQVADYMTLSESQDSSLNKRLSSSSATLPSVTERASPSPHRSPYRGSPSRVERKKNNNGGTPGPIMEPKEPSKEPPKEPKTPQMEKQVGCTTPSLIDPSPKRLESPTTPTKSASTKTQKHHGTPKSRVRSSKSRTQSPCSPGQYPPSPMRHRASTPCDGPRRLEGEEKAAMETRGTSTLERKTSRSENAERKMPKSASRDLGERSAESPGTPTGKSFAGTTDAEEAARLLAERRRQARVQKELEDKQRAEEERLRAEEEQRRQEEAREQQEQAALWAEQERRRQEEARQQKELEDRRQRERRWQEIQDQWEREKEEAVLRAHREAERKQQERELVKIQEEQERLQRKKRIEEIMKRTRKSEEPKKEDVLVESPSPETVQECRDLKQASVGQRQRPEPLGAVESPLISLQPLEAKSCVADDLSDGVQSMDVSPVSRDELVSVADYSPVPEAPQSSVSNAKALEDLLEITGQDAYPSLPSSATLGDLNKNLIEGFSRPGADSQLIQSSASDKLGV
ncbi:MAP7 domain-containing protein 2 isoform X3 [Alosa sapidissima]|uniref:MAP7 domain-containing protein 2 isoform X3 n=1 Tax=Alosa sapidissima TaxID=34773 RepID=UPI001C08D26E|nr:MAP7 domain-containing protein 2 isoform X3 [Alosa sapidissima]